MLYVLAGVKSVFDNFFIKLLLSDPLSSGLNLPDEGERILVVRLDHKIGDMICFSAFLKELRNRRPHAQITLILHSSAAELYKHCPYVDHQLVFDWGKSLPLSLIHRVGRIRAFVQNHNLRQDWDLAIVSRFDEDFHAPFLAYASGARRRVAFRSNVTPRKAQLMRGTDVLFTETYASEGVRHEVERNLELLDRLFPIEPSLATSATIETWQSEEDLASAHDLLRQQGLEADTPLISIGLGAYAPKRVWPVERYAHLIDALREDPPFADYQFAFLGAPSERYLGERALELVQDRAGVVNLAGQTGLQACASVLRSSLAFVGNDSGLLHLAAAAGCACVEISCHPTTGAPEHSNSPIRFGPYTPKKAILQPEAIPPCRAACIMEHAHCIASIPTEAVLSALRTLLQSLPSSGARS